MTRPILIDNIGLSIEYLGHSKEQKLSTCSTVIEAAMGKMSNRASFDSRKELVKNVLEVSIKFHEDHEMYEQCVIFNDLKEYLETLQEHQTI